jgi:UrcA family protein
MKHSKFITCLVSGIAIVAICTPVIASADEKSELKGQSEKVTYEDLNLGKEAGAHVLYRRLQQASKKVCGVESLKSRKMSAQEASTSRHCYSQTLTAAVDRFDNKNLASMHTR